MRDQVPLVSAKHLGLYLKQICYNEQTNGFPIDHEPYDSTHALYPRQHPPVVPMLPPPPGTITSPAPHQEQQQAIKPTAGKSHLIFIILCK